ncbi:ABC transporter ATP-binding protein [Brucella intermedia]|uniref:ABC transporter ATP-binding protein n=1 Tax=Brucella intermedia TaxID=94625 RepID=UPI00124D01FC|nr:ABC transporter ATP-binding protein [Brucella intermedia]KAB2711378.1 ABC transporter ATP-binding protein [Brucella intermedia]
MANPIVEIRNVHKRFGNFVALQDVNLTIEEGEIVTLLGPSGCGKSTLMRMVAGFDDPTEGEIRIAGRSVNGTPPDRRPVNMVFQRYALFPHLDVFDNVAFGLRVKRLPSRQIVERVNHMISVVQLDPFKHRYIHELSGGQCQRVALARALINEPEVLLLDEPLAALDLKIRQHMLAEMKRIHEATGAAFLYVTHDQDEALFLSDRIVLLEKGKILQVDTPPDIYRKPRSLFAAKFLGETNLIPATVVRMALSGIYLRAFDGTVFFSNQNFAGRDGQSVTVSLRPEAITVQPISEARGAEGTYARALCQQSTFLGSRTFLDVAVGTNTHLRIQRTGVSDIPPVGGNIFISWRPEDVVVLTN